MLSKSARRHVPDIPIVAGAHSLDSIGDGALGRGQGAVGPFDHLTPVVHDAPAPFGRRRGRDGDNVQSASFYVEISSAPSELGSLRLVVPSFARATSIFAGCAPGRFPRFAFWRAVQNVKVHRRNLFGTPWLTLLVKATSPGSRRQMRQPARPGCGGGTVARERRCELPDLLSLFATRRARARGARHRGAATCSLTKTGK